MLHDLLASKENTCIVVASKPCGVESVSTGPTCDSNLFNMVCYIIILFREFCVFTERESLPTLFINVFGGFHE